MQETGHAPFKDSKFFDFIELERREIDTIQWLESERAGYSVDRERATWIWVWQYRAAWRRGLRESGLY